MNEHTDNASGTAITGKLSLKCDYWYVQIHTTAISNSIL